jgi:hypothetical protein
VRQKKGLHIFACFASPEPQGKDGPLTPALSPSEGERGNRRQVSGETRFRGSCLFHTNLLTDHKPIKIKNGRFMEMVTAA